MYVYDIAHMEQTNIALKQISGLITTGSAYIGYDQRFKSLSYIKVISLATFIIVLGTGCILAYAYGMYYYQKNKKDIAYLKRNGLSKREFVRLLWEDIYHQFIVIYLCGIAFSIVIFYSGMKRGMHIAFDWISLKGLELAMILMVYGILLMILTRLYYYIKINKHVD